MPRTTSEAAGYIVMLGPAPDAFGGMASVVKAYQVAGLFDMWPILYLDTTAEVRILGKLALLVRAIMAVVVMGVRGKVQGLHIHVATGTSFYRKSIFMLLAWGFGLPYLIHVHGAEFDLFYSRDTGRVGRRYIEGLFNRSAAVIVLGESWRKFVASITTNPRVVCIYNPVALPRARSSSVTNNASQTILFLGRLGSRKGVADLLRAVAELRVRVPGVRLCLCGDGDVGEFSQLAHDLEISEHVLFRGWVVGEEKARLLSESTVLALPSYNEGLPMAILEAMAVGLPVVATRVGGIPDAIEDGSEGLLVSPGDVSVLAGALERLLVNPELREKVAAAALRKVREKFEDSIIVQQVSNLYQEIGFSGLNSSRVPVTHKW